MSVPSQTNTAIARFISSMPRFRIFREVRIWNAAWREYRNLQTLDAAALADMAMSDAARASVTIAQIAARMRG